MIQSVALGLGLLCPVAAAIGQVTPQVETFSFDRNEPLLGIWIGNLSGPGPKTRFACIVVEPSPDGPASVNATILAVAARNQTASEVVIEDRSIRFSFLAKRQTVRISATASQDGQELIGTASFSLDDSGESESATLQLRRTLRPRDLPAPATFDGKASHPAGMTLDMAIMLAATPHGNWVGQIDIPMLNLRDYPLTNIQNHGDTITADVPLGRPATIEATFAGGMQQLTGSFTQGPLALTIDLARNPNYVFRDLPRPQHPKPPFPYHTRDLLATHPDGHSLGGTLTLPDTQQFGPGPYPAAVLISGGGREDRDSSALGHKPFLVIADYLTRQGIAVMRFDDRGVGASKVNPDTLVGKDATSRLHATDTLAVVRHLRTLGEIDPDRIGLIGHSEGGLIAPMVSQMDRRIAFMVLLAGPGVRGDALFRKQFEMEWSMKGTDANTVADLSNRFGEVQKLIVQQAPEELLRPAFREMAQAMIDAGLLPHGDPPEPNIEAAMTELAEFNAPWWRFVFAYDPAPALAAANCPVLALNGTKDLQVWHEQNLDAIVRVIRRAGGDVTAGRYEGLNHIFQPAITGSPAEYARIEITFDKRVLRDIAEWIIRKVVH